MSDAGTYAAQAGQRMRLVRQAWKLSLARVEEESGGQFDACSLTKWELGDRAMKAETLARYAHWLGVDIRVLLPPLEGKPDPLPEVIARIAAAAAVRDMAGSPGRAETGSAA